MKPNNTYSMLVILVISVNIKDSIEYIFEKILDCHIFLK